MSADAPGDLTPEHAVRIMPRPVASSLLRARYGGFALLLEESFQHVVRPAGRRGAARSSRAGGLRHQVQSAEQGPGVRRQL